MQFGAVTLVLAEAVFRITGAEVAHNRIARHFSDDARGRDAQTQAIAVDDRGLRKRKRENGQPIDEDVFGRRRERRNRHAHCLMRGAQNIDPVYLKGIDDADCPGDRRIADEVVIDFLAQRGCELLGIVEFVAAKFFRKNHCGRDHRPSESAAPRFINPGDASDTDGAQFLFVTKAATHLANQRLNELTICKTFNR